MKNRRVSGCLQGLEARSAQDLRCSHPAGTCPQILSSAGRGASLCSPTASSPENRRVDEGCPASELCSLMSFKAFGGRAASDVGDVCTFTST